MGSAESEEYDQTLDSVYVGPVPEGRHMFVFQVRAWFCEAVVMGIYLGEFRVLILDFCRLTLQTQVRYLLAMQLA